MPVPVPVPVPVTVLSVSEPSHPRRDLIRRQTLVTVLGDDLVTLDPDIDAFPPFGHNEVVWMGRRRSLAESELVLGLPCQGVRTAADELTAAAVLEPVRGGVHSLAEFGDLPAFLDDAETAERLFEFGVMFSSSAVTAASQCGSGTLAAAVR
ncbi:hypothetical protein ACFV8E_09945 [Streptomyces sp. NPDC059849]|uniref:hypothetical protein n=1 Tax=Streptomyces sp. NPDC059849 TaxID=3346969 RepID=UPI003654ACD0